MASQNNSGQQYDKQHSVTIVATVVLAANRIVAYDGGYATTAAGGVKDAQGVSENAAAVGEALPVTTTYSQLVECSEAVAFGDYIKPAVDATGRGAVGTLADHCGRALGATTAAGQLFEMQIVRHVHA
jgi:hypothetical protein